MDTLLISTGLLIRTIQLIVPSFSKTDLFTITLALVAGLIFAVKAETMLAFPFGFALMIAVFYKDKILPTITEGTIFLYGTVAVYIFVRNIESLSTLSNSNVILLLFLSMYVFGGLCLCLTKTKVPLLLQIVLMVFFLSSAIYIAYQSSIVFLVSETTPFALFLIGYFSLYFISHVLYVLALVPLPGKHQTFKDRMKEVRKHAAFLEKKYSDKDINLLTTFCLIFVILFAFTYDYIFNDWLTSVTALLVIGGYVVAPENFKLLNK